MSSDRPSWLPVGKQAAVCLSVDDVHPGRSSDPYEAGGDLRQGCLGHLAWLLERHPGLRSTLFVTPDWRPISVAITRHRLAALPLVRDRLFLARPHPVGTMRLARHPEFVAFLRQLPRTDVALHGLHHLHRGPELTTEFQRQSERHCRRMLRRAMSIFDEAQLPFVRGLQPPSWHLPSNLARAMASLGLRFVSSARDLSTPITPGARAAGSGLHGVALLAPERLAGSGLVHFPVNYQATSSIDRAMRILDAGGLLSIKAHAIKNLLGHVMPDGLDADYREHLHRLFSTIEARYGDAVWWTSMAEVTAAIDAGRAATAGRFARRRSSAAEARVAAAGGG